MPICRAPEEPGHYLLQVDLLCDGVDWFANRNRWTPVSQADVLVGEAAAEEVADE